MVGPGLDDRLRDEFEADEGAVRVVARQARDLADAGQFEADAGRALTDDEVIANLRDAPEDLALPETWNWWMGSLELAYGGYDRFHVVRWSNRSE